MCYNSIVHKWVQLVNPLYFYAKECCIMKYCPYCGADLLGGTVSFCSECGKSIKGRKTKAKSEKKPPAERKKKTKTKVPKDAVTETKPEETIESVDDGYDGYYDDVLPVDENVERQGLDKTMVKNLVIIIAGVIVAISICVAAMYFM